MHILAMAVKTKKVNLCVFFLKSVVFMSHYRLGIALLTRITRRCFALLRFTRECVCLRKVNLFEKPLLLQSVYTYNVLWGGGPSAPLFSRCVLETLLGQLY